MLGTDLTWAHGTTRNLPLAFMSLDPDTASAFVDMARAMLGASVTDAAWRSIMRRSESTMRDRVLEMSTRKPLRGDRVRLFSAAGKARTFAELAAGRTTMVAFGANLLRTASPVNLAAMERLSAALATDNARLVVIALHARTADVPKATRERGLALDVFFDEYHDADRAFSAYGVPLYFVVDRAGTIRFSYSDVGELHAGTGARVREAIRAATPVSR